MEIVQQKNNLVVFILPEEKIKPGEKYTLNQKPLKVIDFFTVYKDMDPFPEGMFLLVTGKRLTGDQVFGKFKKSEKVFIFLGEVEEIEEDETPDLI